VKIRSSFVSNSSSSSFLLVGCKCTSEELDKIARYVALVDEGKAFNEDGKDAREYLECADFTARHIERGEYYFGISFRAPDDEVKEIGIHKLTDSITEIKLLLMHADVDREVSLFAGTVYD